VTKTANSEIGTGSASSSGETEVLSFAVIAADESNLPVYWIKYDPAVTGERQLIGSLNEILVDPVFQRGTVLKDGQLNDLFNSFKNSGFRWLALKQFLPGVTDNLAHTIAEALKLKGVDALGVASGSGHLFAVSGDNASQAEDGHSRGAETVDGQMLNQTADFNSAEEVQSHAQYKLFHPLVEKLSVLDLDSSSNVSIPGFPDVLSSKNRPPEIIELSGLTDTQLVSMSRERLLALTLEEMQAIRDYYNSKDVSETREKLNLPKAPTDVELEVIAQTWSEHCKHKIFSAKIEYSEKKNSTDNAPKVSNIDSLYKTFIKGATRELKPRRPDLLSVFEDNSGVVKWNDDSAVCFKVETHNSPSALEPYGGALTGILGVNRDILGTGLGAKPIFNTDVFCFAHPDSNLADRPKMLPPAAIPSGVRKGVQDGGNKSGIPTVNGSLFFHDGYRAKPLVFCGTGGILPIARDGINLYEKHTKAGDRIIMVGGRVGKDGIHGATFSSESMHEGSPVTAVQIGDPFTQKRVIDFVLAARDNSLISGITDNGAGGLSSSVGEMATFTGGASIDLNAVPLKYPGLDDWQIVVSESQERMTISTSQTAALRELAEAYNVEVSDIGEFHDRGYFEIKRGEKTVGVLDLKFLHDGYPRLDLKAEWYPMSDQEIAEAQKSHGDNETALSTRSLKKSAADRQTKSFNSHLRTLLSHPNIASKEFLIRQYDHEVQGASVVTQSAPCDAAVLKPVLAEAAGLVVSNGLCPQWSIHDPYLMAICAVDEAVRNAVAVGVDPETICVLDNFCWPDPVRSERNPDGEYKLGQLVRTCQGLYDICVEYGAPLISGKDSMKNDFDDGVVRLSIPPTLLVSAIGKTPDSLKVVTMQFKQPGDLIYVLSAGKPALTGSHYAALFQSPKTALPSLDLKGAHLMYMKLFQAIQSGLVNSAHDTSEGGLAVALAECCIGSGLGANITLEDTLTVLERSKVRGDKTSTTPELEDSETAALALFGEGPGTLVVTVSPRNLTAWEELWKDGDLVSEQIGTVSGDSRLLISGRSKDTPGVDLSTDQLKTAWTAPLPFD
jgi:phosphoribosylformylglycinamidine synthase